MKFLLIENDQINNSKALFPTPSYQNLDLTLNSGIYYI